MWGIIIVATIRIYSSNWTGGQDIASTEEKMLLPQATKLNETRQLLAKQTHVAHVQQPLATTNTNHDNLNDNTQQIQFVKEINLLKY